VPHLLSSKKNRQIVSLGILVQINFDLEYLFLILKVLKDLSSFLTQEIKQESDNRKHKVGLPKVAGFEVKSEGPNVTLTKTHDSEKYEYVLNFLLVCFILNFNFCRITVKFNINGSLDNSEPPMDEQMDLEKAKNEAESSQVI
jgi:hypothetical protein